MKQKLTGLSQRYATALRKYLKPGPGAHLQPALRLGRQAIGLGLDTLGLARIHERALVTLRIASGKHAAPKRAGRFFAEAITPMVEAHRIVVQNHSHLGRLRGTLVRRTAELAAAHLRMQQVVARSKVVENVFVRHGVHHKKRLEESLKLQSRLRRLTRLKLAAKEHERRKISRELQNEIAETLLGIHVRLLSLKQEAWSCSVRLKKKIASTQLSVKKSVKSVRRFARKLDLHQPPPEEPSGTPL